MLQPKSLSGPPTAIKKISFVVNFVIFEVSGLFLKVKDNKGIIKKMYNV